MLTLCDGQEALKPIIEERRKHNNPFMQAALALCSKAPTVFKAA
jgi:hypothetical protein